MANKMVVGHGLAALRAAAVLGASQTVLLSELPEASLVEDAGWFEHGAGTPQVERLYGAAPGLSAEAGSRGLLHAGEVHRLPLSPRDVLALFGDDKLGTVGDWARNRVRNSFKGVHTGGREERTYSDWVTHRFGAGAASQLFEPYANLRWGAADRISVSHARRAHGLAARGEARALGADVEAGRTRLAAQAGSVVQGSVVGLRLGTDGRIAEVETAEGLQPVDQLWCACAPSDVVAWLGDALDPGIVFDARKLTASDFVAVELELDGAEELPGELHITVPEAPCFRLSRTGIWPGASEPRRVLAALTPAWTARATDPAAGVEVAAAVSRLGLGQARATGRTSVIVAHHPAWYGPWYPAHLRVAQALEALGIHLVGRAGTFRCVDVGQELAHLVGLSEGEDARELRRKHLDPPVNLLDAPAIGRFVVR